MNSEKYQGSNAKEISIYSRKKIQAQVLATKLRAEKLA